MDLEIIGSRLAFATFGLILGKSIVKFGFLSKHPASERATSDVSFDEGNAPTSKRGLGRGNQYTLLLGGSNRSEASTPA